jgi:hypothetical protein
MNREQLYHSKISISIPITSRFKEINRKKYKGRGRPKKNDYCIGMIISHGTAI